ncbi:FCS-Like Zinc finger 8 [Camellia lanceoleosa]|uniref:FCS-Like Zinc finger 8 n=1 Tax=Camellia lanceoleosa TaxID=1840588 RepID=A0ACC0GV30_9ERIC|nr:FCS-Like Zinc finger 8 [Camellia lanceoleosa]
MLRKRSRTTSKQALMADHGYSPSSKESYRKPISSIFSSPRMFTDTESELSSPTSILDSKPFSALRKPFRSDSHTTKTPKPEIQTHWDSRRVGLGLVDALSNEKSDPNQTQTSSEEEKKKTKNKKPPKRRRFGGLPGRGRGSELIYPTLYPKSLINLLCEKTFRLGPRSWGTDHCTCY